MILASKFDVLRGWPKEGAIDECFPVHLSSGVPDSIPLGSLVAVQSDGSVALATTVNVATTNGTAVWIVVEGNDDFSGTFLQKVNCIRGNAMVRLDPANFAAGSYPPGTQVSFASGLAKVAAANDQVIGEVIEDDIAVDGTIVVYFSGGLIVKK